MLFKTSAHLVVQFAETLHMSSEMKAAKCPQCLHYDDINDQPECQDCNGFSHFLSSAIHETNDPEREWCFCDLCEEYRICNVIRKPYSKLWVCDDCMKGQD